MTEAAAEIDLYIGKPVTFVDPTGRRIPALVTALHGFASKEARDANNVRYFEANKGTPYVDDEWLERNNNAPLPVPSINVVFVVTDESKTDSYGRQIDRATSVPHESNQTAHGYKYVL